MKAKKMMTVSVSLMLVLSGLIVMANSGIAKPVEDIRATLIVTPGDSIQDAIDVADPGDIIQVWNGTYHERLTINKPLSLIGNHSASTVIWGNGTGDVVSAVSASQVNITGFTIHGSGPDNNDDFGLELSSSPNSKVENIHFVNNTNHLNVFSSGDCTVRGNIFNQTNARGMWIQGSSHNSFVSNNTFYSTQTGISITSADYLTISNNTFSNTNIGIGFYSGANNNIIKNNEFNIATDGIRLGHNVYGNEIVGNNITSSQDGIELNSVNNNLIEGNTIFNNTRGIYVINTAHNNTMANNTLFFNMRGIEMQNTRDNDIINNEIFGNVSETWHYAIYINGADHNNIIGNDIYESRSITITGGGRFNYVAENDIYSNNQDGIELNSVNNNLIERNTIFNNPRGIYILNAAHNNTVADNFIFNCTEGISLDDSNYNEIRGNTVLGDANLGATNHGIYTSDSNDNLVVGNTAIDNHMGIYLMQSSDSIVQDNNVSSNRHSGIYLQLSNDNILTSNTARSNLNYGVTLWDAENNSVYHNIFIDNVLEQAYDNGNNNEWDAGYPDGGNYWNDHTGPDNNRGPEQDIWGADGIVDDNRTIEGGDGVDNYPWTNEDFLHEYIVHELFMYPAEQTRVMVGDNVTITAIAWDNDLNLPVPDIELEFDWYDWGQAGNASFVGPSTAVTDENGTAQVIFDPGVEVGDQWIVEAYNWTIGVQNQTEFIEVVWYRGDLMIYDEEQNQLVGDDHYEAVPAVQIVEQGVAKGGSTEFMVRVQNDGSVDDNIIFSWDNSTFPTGWKMNVTTHDLDTWEEIDVTTQGHVETYMWPGNTRDFYVEVHSDPAANYEDRVHVNISVLDSGHQYDNGTLEAYIPTPDVMWMSIAFDEEEALDPAHDGPPLPLNDSLGGMNLPPDMWLPFWGVLYNSTTQTPVEIVAVDWTLTNESGAAASIDPSSGSTNKSVWLNTGSGDGKVTLNASYEITPGVWWNDTWTFNVTVGWDYVLITDTPDGTEVPDQDVEFADTMELWASVYNDTHGFVTTTIIADWDYDWNMIRSVDWFIEGGVEVQFIGVGEVLVELYVDTPDGELYDNVTFNISQPDVDFIQITDEPDGDWLWNDYVDVGQYRWYNISAYNDELGWAVYLPDINEENIQWNLANEDGSTGELEVIDGMAKVYTGRTGGRINLTASYYDEEQDQWFHSNELNIHVSQPRIDEIAISYTPDGENKVESGTIAYGVNITGHACAYNDTIGFIGLVNGNWYVTNSGTVSSTTNPGWGNESVFSAESDPSQTGDSWWNLDVYDGNYDTWHTYNVNFDFLTVDWINITYFDGTVVTDDTQIIANDELELYVSAYNWTQGGDHRIGFVPVSWLLTNDGNTEASIDPTVDSLWTLLNAGTKAGEIQIKATYGGMEDSVILQITPDSLDYVRIELQDGILPLGTYSADETTTVYLRGYDQYDNLIGDVNGNWSLDGDNATLSSSTGTSVTVDWKLVGTVTLTAEHSGLTDDITVTVTHGVLDSIEVTPEDSEITADDTQQFEAKGYDAEGNEITGLTFTWEATNGTISTDGLFTPWSTEDVTISAMSGNVTGSTSITVTLGAVNSVIISPDEAQTVDPGDEIVFTAEAFDSKNNLITDTLTDFTWQNADDGVFSQEDPGEYEVTAIYENTTSSPTVVTVTATEPFFVVTITGYDGSVFEGETVTVSYNIENTGGPGTQDIVFSIDGLEEDTYTGLTLEADELYDGEFVWQAGDAGEYELTVASDDTNESVTVTVDQIPTDQPYFSVTITDHDATVTEGDEVTIWFNVVNIGGISGTQDIVFSIDGLEEDTYTGLTLEADELYDGEFVWQAGDAGEYELTVASDDTNESVTVTVDQIPTDQPYFSVTITGHDATITEGDEVTIWFNVVNIGGISGTQDIVLRMDGSQIDIHTALTLDVDEEYNGEFVWQSDDAGEYEFTVASDDTSDSVEITVEEDSELPPDDDEPIDAGFLEDYWWLLLLLIIIIVVIAVMAKRGKKEPMDQPYEEPPSEQGEFEEQPMEKPSDYPIDQEYPEQQPSEQPLQSPPEEGL